MGLYTSQMDREIVLIAHNIRSTHNVGSLLRTCDGLGVKQIYLTGYTPYPAMPDDIRLPHIAKKLNDQINKTALGAQQSVKWSHAPDAATTIEMLSKRGFCIMALEQSTRSVPLNSFKLSQPTALLVGEEVNGIEPKLMNMCDIVVEIPMSGKKESFNVAVAAGMALYQFRFG